METGVGLYLLHDLPGLETFLGGMETLIDLVQNLSVLLP